MRKIISDKNIVKFGRTFRLFYMALSYIPGYATQSGILIDMIQNKILIIETIKQKKCFNNLWRNSEGRKIKGVSDNGKLQQSHE